MKKFFYRVREGESVFALARRFGVSPAKIIKDNLLRVEVSCGDVLFIETGGLTHTVRPFETLADVAERYNVPPDAIAAVNGTDYLFYGITVIIPDDGTDKN